LIENNVELKKNIDKKIETDVEVKLAKRMEDYDRVT
jgi:hypothetical protein